MHDNNYIPSIYIRSGFNLTRKKEFNLFMYPIFFSYINSLENEKWNENIKSITIIFEENELKEGLTEYFGNHEIISIKRKFDFSIFWELDDYNKKLLLVNTFCSIFENMDTEFNFQVTKEIFKKGIDTVIKNNFNWSGYLTPIKFSPDRKRKIKVRFEYDYEEKIIHVEIEHLSPDKFIIRLFKCSSIPRSISLVIGKITWLNNDEIVIVPKGEFPHFKTLVSLSKKIVEIQGDYTLHGIVGIYPMSEG